MNEKIITNNIKDLCVFLFDKKYNFIILYDNNTYYQIKYINFDFHKLSYEILLKNGNMITISLPFKVLKYRKFIKNFLYSSFDNYKNNNIFFELNHYGHLEKRENLKDFINNNFEDKFIFGNLNKSKIFYKKDFIDFMNFI